MLNPGNSRFKTVAVPAQTINKCLTPVTALLLGGKTCGIPKDVHMRDNSVHFFPETFPDFFIRDNGKRKIQPRNIIGIKKES